MHQCHVGSCCCQIRSWVIPRRADHKFRNGAQIPKLLKINQLLSTSIRTSPCCPHFTDWRRWASGGTSKPAWICKSHNALLLSVVTSPLVHTPISRASSQSITSILTSPCNLFEVWYDRTHHSINQQQKKHTLRVQAGALAQLTSFCCHDLVVASSRNPRRAGWLIWTQKLINSPTPCSTNRMLSQISRKLKLNSVFKNMTSEVL